MQSFSSDIWIRGGPSFPPPFYFLLCVFVNIIRLACSISDGQHLLWYASIFGLGFKKRRCAYNAVPYRFDDVELATVSHAINGPTWGRQATLSIENSLHLCKDGSGAYYEIFSFLRLLLNWLFKNKRRALNPKKRWKRMNRFVMACAWFTEKKRPPKKKLGDLAFTGKFYEPPMSRSPFVFL